MRKHLILFIMAAFVALTACKKDDTETTDNTPPDKKTMLCKAWKMKEVYINSDYSSVKPYDTWIFTWDKNNTYSFQRTGAVEAGPWEFNSDQTKIIFYKGTTQEKTWTLLGISTDLLKLRIQEGKDETDYFMVPY